MFGNDPWEKLFQSHRNICSEAIQNGSTSEGSKLKRKSVIKFLEAVKCKPCEIYRRICDVHREACFSQKMFTNQLNMGLPLWTRVDKTVHRVEAHWLSIKKKFHPQSRLYWQSSGTWNNPSLLISFKNVWHSASYCQLLWQNSSSLLNDTCVNIYIYIYIYINAHSHKYLPNFQWCWNEIQGQFNVRCPQKASHIEAILKITQHSRHSSFRALQVPGN